MTRRPRALTPDEAELWRGVIKGVKPLKSPARQKLAMAPPLPAPKPPTLKPTSAKPPPPVAPPRSVARPQAASIDRPTLKKLARGSLPVEGRLDLHGMTQAEAHAALIRFVERMAKAEKRSLLVITGKGSGGEGALRRAVPRWLSEGALGPLVRGLAPARAGHGGEGALYVLLKRRRRTP